MPILVVEKGAEKGATLQIETGHTFACGRDPASGLVLSDTMASRAHFEIADSDRGFVLRDLDSRNGTYLNDEPVTEEMLLRIGDKIQVGETLMSYLSDGKEETPQGLVGKTVGGYRIIERIGRGGMGTVYKASQLSLNRVVALKVLSARLLQDQSFVDQFQHEARAAGQLNHANIVQVYDVGSAQGIHFFSMEFMEAGSVQDVIGKEDRVGWEEALDMMMDAARGLVFAERNDIVHRDIKPDNLMLLADGTVKIGDLGLATQAEDGESRNAKGSIFGTPHFISPEQAQGLEVSHAADLYSLGATFYRILSGRTPFQAVQIQDIIRKQIQEQPPPLRTIVPDVPQAIATLIERLMKKAPEDRYASATDLLADLEAIRMTHHPAMRGQKKRTGLLVGALVVAVAAIGGVLVLTGGGNGNDQPPPKPDNGTPTIIERPVEDPEKEAEARRLKARNALLTIMQGAPKAVTEENYGLAVWTELFKRLRAEVVEPYGDTPAAQEATTYIETTERSREDVSTKIRGREEARAAELAAIRTRVGKVTGNLRGLLEAKKYAEALDAWEAVEDAKSFRKDPPSAEAYRKLKAEIESEAKAYRQGVEEAVTTLDSAGKDREALAAVRKFLAAWNPTGRKESVFSEGKGWGERQITALETEIRRTLGEQLDADFKRYVPAYRRVRRIAPVGEGANQVFEFDFAGAATELRELLDGESGLATWPYRDRLKRKIADLERMERFMVRFVELVKAGKAKTLTIEIKTGLTSEYTISSPSIDRAGFRAEFSRGSLTGSLDRKFAEFTPRELYETVLLEGERVPLEPRDRVDLALLLAELGVHDGAEKVLAGLAAPDEETRAVLDRLNPEIEAAKDWAKILEASRRSGRDSRAVKARATSFEERYARTDLFLLLGETPPANPGLVSAETVTAFLEGLGEPK